MEVPNDSMEPCALTLFIFGGLSGSIILGMTLWHFAIFPLPIALLAGIVNFLLFTFISFKVDGLIKSHKCDSPSVKEEEGNNE